MAVSIPLPPSIISLPAPPSIVSLPPYPKAVSSPSRKIIVSSPEYPWTFVNGAKVFSPASFPSAR